MQVTLCFVQSAFWQSREQYFVSLHLEQVSVPTLPQKHKVSGSSATICGTTSIYHARCLEEARSTDYLRL